MDVMRDAEVLTAEELEVRPRDHVVRAGDRALVLSERELELLVELARHAGRVVPRAELYAAVWGGEMRADDRSVDVYVHRLRTKLGAALPHRSFIHTHFGRGYRFEPELSPPFHKTATTS
jgi:DNA-binding response OmpR family regulator